MRLDDLMALGFTKMRLPIWRQAYLVIRPEGPWADLYDVGAGIGSGEPIPVLIGECSQATEWEAVEE